MSAGMRVVGIGCLGLAVLLAGVAACGEDTLANERPDASSERDGGAVADPDAAADADAGPVIPVDVAPDVRPIRDQYGLPALATLALRHGAVVGFGVTGVRKAGGTTAATLADRFAIGEAAQVMTVTLAAVLVDAGVLTWTTTLGDVFGDIHADYKQVSLEALVAQRGGTPKTIPGPVLASARGAGTPRSLRASAARAILAAPPEAAAGGIHESDAAFVVAAAMLEARADAAFEDLLQTRLFAPLGIASCAPGPSAPATTEDLPWGHVPVEASLVPVAPGSDGEPPPALAPALGLRCTLDDLARFGTLHLRGARSEPTPLLGAPSLQKLQKPIDGLHAFGWFAVSRTWAGAKLALTAGSRETSAYVRIWVLPDKDAVLVAATNQGGQAAIKGVDDAIGELVGCFVVP